MRKYQFDAVKAREEAIEWIRNQSKAANFTKVVLGISGGKDSTIAAALCCRALGKENVMGLLLPNGEQKDINDSIEICKALGIKSHTINIRPIYDSYLISYGLGVDNEEEKCTTESLINLPPRIRMSTLRLYGQSNHRRLCGTGNLSEVTVGYCTKDGDTSCDLNPLGGLTSIEVVEVGKTMEEIPTHLVVKTPSDGLCGMSDEEKLGVLYIDIHKYIRNIEMDLDLWKKIHAMDIRSLHKRTTAPYYIPSDSVLYVE